jgi:hypothetical protein
MEYIPFCDQSLQRHEQIVTDKHFSSSDISVHIRRASQRLCWVGNSGSWRAWGKTGRRSRFGYLGGGELKTTDLGSGIGVHSSVYPYFYGFGA